MPGVWHTRAGYAGGTTENPTYHNLDGHSETVQADFDPSCISYRELLDVFWNSHNPVNHSSLRSRQYMSVIFYHNDAQKKEAEESKKREEARRGVKFNTEISPFSGFYPAEDYHQKYWLQQAPEFLREFERMYPDFNGLVNSTAAARVNGYLEGNGSAITLEEELGSYGLSAAANKRLLEIARTLKD